MTRTRTLALASLAMLGGITLAAAQPAPPPAPTAPPSAPSQAGQDAGPDQMHGPIHGQMRGEGRSDMMERHGRGMMGGGMRVPRGAHFTLERDGAVIDLHCAEAETTRACVDAAAVLLDKLGPQPAPGR